VSCVAKEDEVSLSAKLRIRSTKEGTDPVVKPLTRGIVTVGGAACAVYGIALPSRMRLLMDQSPCRSSSFGCHTFV